MAEAAAAIRIWLTRSHDKREKTRDVAAESLKFEGYSIHRAFKEFEQRDDRPTFVFRPRPTRRPFRLG
jgi:hypothetical protein